MKTVKAKFHLTAVKNEDGSMNVSGNAVTSGSEENKAFNDATPYGLLNIHIAKDKEAQSLFEGAQNKEYFLDITVAEELADSEGATQE